MTKTKIQPLKSRKPSSIDTIKNLTENNLINNWYWIGAILLLTIVAFYPSLTCKFVHWDDQAYVSESELIKSLSFENIKRIFSFKSVVALNYHPITILSLAIDYKFAKVNPFYYHLVNVIIHLLNTFLVFLFTYKLSGRKLFVGLFVSLFFAIHPMHVESVTWIAERKDVLYTFFFIGGLLTYLKYIESLKRKFLIYTFLLFSLSVLSKAMAVVFPLVLFLIDYYNNRKISLKVIAEKIPLLILSILFGVLALHLQANEVIASYYKFGFIMRICFGFYAFSTYIWKMFLPINLSSFYPYPVANAQGMFPLSIFIVSFCGIIFLILIGIFSVLKKEKMKLFAFGTGFFFVTVVTVLQFFSIGGAVMADRYTYLSYIGLLFVLGTMLNSFISKYPSYKKMVFIFIALISIVFSYATHERTKVWTNADTLWKNVMDQYPSPPYKIAETYQANLGTSFGEKGQEFQRIGDQVQAMEMYKKSIMYFSNVLLTDSNSVPMLINRALVYELIQNYDLALEDYSKALLIEPLNMDLRESRANSLYKLNKAEEAIMEYNKLIFMDSSRTSLFHYRGIAKFNLGMEKEAIEDFKVIVQRQPLNAKAYYQLSVCYNNINDNANALFYAEKAIQFGLRIDPNYVDSLRNTLKK